MMRFLVRAETWSNSCDTTDMQPRVPYLVQSRLKMPTEATTPTDPTDFGRHKREVAGTTMDPDLLEILGIPVDDPEIITGTLSDEREIPRSLAPNFMNITFQTTAMRTFKRSSANLSQRL